METESRMSIQQLADAAGLTRRAIRFYVQRGLLPAPAGLGRGNHYSAEHLARLRQIRELQGAGHSLEAIARIFAGETVAPPAVSEERRRRAVMSAELWTRLRLGEGIEIHYDATRHHPDALALVRLREAIRGAFGEVEGFTTESTEDTEKK